ncbi:MAG TPA: hypothetical protein VGE52_03110 [Pirellulales bacterium]
MTSSVIRPRWGLRLAVAAALAAGSLGFGASAFAADRIETISESGSVVVLSGAITAMSKDFVTIDVKGEVKKTPVDEIKEVQFDGEALPLRQVRNRVQDGRYEDGLRDALAVDKSKFEGERALNMQQDLEFFTAICTAALAFENAKPLADAEKLLTAFVAAHPGNFHILEAQETLGNVEAALGKYPEAEKAYSQLTQSTLESYKLRGTVLLGYTQLKQGKNADALRSFEEVAKASGSTAAVKRQINLAKLGQAACLAADNKAAEGEKLARQVIKELPKEEDAAIYAKAYNTLGVCLEGSNDAAKAKAALNAFLHVDVLYNRAAQEHAEALYHLAKLWKATDEERATECAELLKSRYGNSSWAKQPL